MNLMILALIVMISCGRIYQVLGEPVDDSARVGYIYRVHGRRAAFIILAIASRLEGYVNEESRLMNDLLEADRYDVRVRPVRNSSTAVLVRCGYVLEAILQIDEHFQAFHAFGWIRMEWHDEFLQWDPKEYGNVETLIISSSTIWMPDVINRNAVEQVYGDILDNTKRNPEVLHTGHVLIESAGKTSTSCLLDVTYFPFDRQKCSIELDSWSYDSTKLSLKVFENVDRTRYQPNGEWSLMRTDVRNETVPGAENFDVVRFTFHLKRKSTYFTLMIMIPCVTQSLMTVLVFLVPPESGEKISLQITILLSFSVFQLTIADSIPKTSDHLSILSIYVNCSILLASLSLFLSVLVLYLQHVPRDVRPIPNWLQFLSNKVIDRIPGSRHLESKSETSLSSLKQTNKIHSSSKVDVKSSQAMSSTNEQSANTKQNENKCAIQETCEDDSPSDAQKAYRILARKCDHMFLIIFSILVLLLFLIIFFAMIFGNHRKTA